MSTRTTLTSGWEPTAATRGSSRSPRIGKDVYEALRESAVLLRTVSIRGPSLPPPQSAGNENSRRPREPQWRCPRQQRGILPHTDRTNEIYLELVRSVDSPARIVSHEKTIEQHLAGQITVNLYAINPETQCCKWVAIDADYDTEQAKRDLAKLRKELLLENVFAVQEYSGEVGICGSSAKTRCQLDSAVSSSITSHFG